MTAVVPGGCGCGGLVAGGCGRRKCLRGRHALTATVFCSPMHRARHENLRMSDETTSTGPMEDKEDNHLPRVRMDFVGEYAGNLKTRLQADGYAVPVELDPEGVCRLYLNFLRRRVPPVPRKVFVASEFSCPQDLQAGLYVVRGKIESGQDLSPHLSSRLKTLEYHDMLLNDWGIHHLHLGTMLKQNGYVERTKFVLFVRFLPAFAYLIAPAG